PGSQWPGMRVSCSVVEAEGRMLVSGTPPALLSLWYLAACLAGRGDRLEYRHPLVAVRNGNNLVTGGLDVVRGEPAASAVIRGEGWWSRAVLGTAAAALPPIDGAALTGLWAGFQGKAGTIALLPQPARFARIGAAAELAGITPTLAGRLLAWSDAVVEHFRNQPVME
ncbi:hypothetical protein, partial [Candidatus Frankia nodulisporulans]